LEKAREAMTAEVKEILDALVKPATVYCNAKKE
jgi:hypothetical protein